MILVAIGANLPGADGSSPLQTCRAAVRALARLPFVSGLVVSRWYETVPVPISGQKNYVNGVAFLNRAPDLEVTPQAAVTPESVLVALQAIESRFGRRRDLANGPRTLDLDLIDMDGIVRTAPDPILPHPRAHLREFVLRPLLDVAPDWICPGIAQTGVALLANVTPSGVRLLANT